MIELSMSAKNARATALRDLLDAGSAGDAAIHLYDSARPAFGEAAGVSPNVTITLGTPAGVVVDGELTLNHAAWELVLRTSVGGLKWARAVDRDGVAVADMPIGLTGSGQPLEINTLDVVLNGLLAVTGAVLRE